MGLGLGLGAAAILWVADQLSLDRQRAQLEGLVALSADRIAEMIAPRRPTTRMLRNDADGVRRMIANIGAQEGVDRIRDLQQGGPRPGVLAAGRGGHARRQALRRVHRLPRGRAAEGRPRAAATASGCCSAPDGGRVLGIITPIYNEPAVHGLPRPPRVAARAGRARRAAVDDPGRRGARAPPSARCSYGLVATGLAVVLLSLPAAVGARAAAGQAAALRHGARRGGRPRGARAGALAATRWASSPAPGTR